jgi:hypothetical protein
VSDNLPTWDELSDLDKGAVLLHLHKRDYEGISYTVENYPARYLDDPRLTTLDGRAASAHAAQFRDLTDKLDVDEYERLYDAALAEPDRRCLWAAQSGPDHRPTPAKTREYAVDLIVKHWPNSMPVADRSQFRLLHRDVPGGEWSEVALTPENAR